MLDEEKLELTDREYFMLESHDGKHRELELERQILDLKQNALKKDLIIMNFRADKIKDEIGKMVEEMQAVGIKQENILVSKQKVSDEITERLQLEDTPDWGYDPITLEIIID